MRILFTGASGMLANDVVKELAKDSHTVIPTDIKPRLNHIIPLDITDREALCNLVEREKPDYIFHLAAETNVDLCEQDPEHAYRINTHGTEIVALACQKYKIRLLYVSTGSVFPGDSQSVYTEEDVPNPVNVYAKSKWEGEKVVAQLLTEYFIVRAGWMVGGWEIDKKFVYKIVQQLASGKRNLRVVSDKFGSPTFTWDFAKHLMPIVETQRYGVYHLANQGTCSRYEMAVRIVEFMGLKNDVVVSPISSDEFPLPAPRPNSEMINNRRLELLDLNDMPHWTESLKEYIEVNKDKYVKVA